MLGKLFILGLYLFAWSFPASAKLFGRRGLSDSRFKNVRTAILTVNGEPTTCEVGVLNSNIALFAASCVVLRDDGFQDMSVRYGIYVYKGDGSSEPAKYDIVNPIQYVSVFDKLTLNANLAIVQFNENSNDTYTGYVSSGPYFVSNSSYTLRPLDFETESWRDPVMVQQENDLVDECELYGRLYRGNKFLLACNNITVESIYDSNCRMPYGALYTMSGDYVALVAIYTHSVTSAWGECQGQRFNYYTYISPFLQFISRRFEVQIHAIDENGTKTVISNTESEIPTVDIEPGVANGYFETTTFGADLYRRYQSRETSKAASESPNDSDTYSDDQWSESESSQTDTSLDSDSDNDGSESSKTTKIIVGVIVGVVLAAVIVGFFVYRWLKVKRNDARWDPRAETTNIHLVGSGLNTDLEHISPPAYSPRQAQDSTNVPRTAPNFRVPES